MMMMIFGALLIALARRPPQASARERRARFETNDLSHYLVLDPDPLEFVFPSYLARWFSCCPRALLGHDMSVFSVAQHKTDVIIEPECSNLTPQELRGRREEVEAAKL
eukprot:5756922-Pyramimonas_sp.AAC.1